jgi:hypothetical protein
LSQYCLLGQGGNGRDEKVSSPGNWREAKRGYGPRYNFCN